MSATPRSSPLVPRSDTSRGPRQSGADNARWVRTGRAEGREVVAVRPGDDPLWVHTGLVVVRLNPGEAHEVRAAGSEAVVVPLQGSVVVGPTESTGVTLVLEGRESVFTGPTDTAYLPDASLVRLTAGDAPVRVAVCLAVREGAGQHAPRRIAAADVPIELRGAGSCSREVRGFGMPGTLDAEQLLACEVITPAGNWSSYPPHKHDENRAGHESVLEEIYYFEVRSDSADPVGYQRVYGTEERPIDVLAEVRTGDAVMIPHGWHGPSMAAPDADLYYLNVMAGPGPERVWRISDDPRHAAIRGTWHDQPVDPRLPMGGAQ